MQQVRQVCRFAARAARLRPSSSLLIAKCTCTTDGAGARWTCACGFNNYDFHRQCFRCSKVRDDVSSLAKVSLETLMDVTAPDVVTEGDGPHKKASDTPVFTAEGTWMCAECYTFNNATRGACVYCGEKRPPRRSSDCVSQSTFTADASFSASSQATQQHASTRQPFLRGDWYCSCGAHNFARNAHCRECRAPIPAQKKEELRHTSSGGSWDCPECGMYNFARRTECMRCHHAKPSPSVKEERDGPTATAASQGWVCQACHSLNPPEVVASCVICGTPR
ncbi:hypothetical protein ABL78_4357 [Leptomonas seymouri]|uniref:RanBP2-type domain-containing protein n=1 Tax=Leptomonas seymouri TaxID=5684 RepID=A0A0N1IKB7_LEPSE|nr:hypothetical protein ABL78_4357 [Leptomonas seymouri]|eukprot:KPI86582.1 hypothetical protein ABL78_4357 [Leptomonas seymouri]